MVAIRQCQFVHSSKGRVDIWMSSGHFSSSNERMDIYLCPMDISVCPMDEWTFECPMDISVRPMDEWTFLFAHWIFVYVQWTCNVYNAKQAAMT